MSEWKMGTPTKRQTLMEPIKVEYHCDECGGNLKMAGRLLSNPPQFEYACRECERLFRTKEVDGINYREVGELR